MGYLDPRELNDLIALAERGGIGKGVAMTDCVAEKPDQLMYISGDELILLRDLGDVLLASCEGIIGWVERKNVRFSSLASGSTSPSPSSTPIQKPAALPATILTAPSPPRPTSSHAHRHSYQYEEDEEGTQLGQTKGDLKRISGPFELDSPQPSPSLVETQGEKGYFETQRVTQDEGQNGHHRDSINSSTSSEAFRGIGGFMMGGNESEDDHRLSIDETVEELKDDSPSNTAIITPHHHADTSSTNAVSPTPKSQPFSHSISQDTLESGEGDDGDFEEEDSEWDIYDDYARESMYGPAKRMSLAIQQKRLSRAAKANSKIPSPLREAPDRPKGEEGEHDPSGLTTTRAAMEGRHRHIPSPETDTFRLPSADKVKRQRQNGSLSPLMNNENRVEENEENQEKEQLTPRLEVSTPTTPNQTTFTKIDMPSRDGRSVATELRLRIMREREESEKGSAGEHAKSVEDGSIGYIQENLITPTDNEHGYSTDPEAASHNVPTASDANANNTGNISSKSEGSDLTPEHQDDRSTQFEHSASEQTPASSLDMSKSTSSQSLLASPLPIDEVITDTAVEVKVDVTDNGIITAPSLVPPPPHTSSPNLSPHINQGPWTPGSPSSPHSISATRQAVDAARSASDGKRPRGLTLVGRMDADLLASKGPVPITFLVDGPGIPVPPPIPTHEPIGLGLPSSRSRASSPHSHEHQPIRRATSPLASPILPDTSNQASPFPPHPHTHPQPPHPVRSATSPVPPSMPVTPATSTNGLHKPTTPFSGRPRARSFSATVAKTLGVGKKESTPPPPALSIKINQTPPVPSINSPAPSVASKKSFFGGRKTSLATTTPANANLPIPSTPLTGTHHENHSTPSVSLSLPGTHPPNSGRSSSFSFNSVNVNGKTPKKTSTGPSKLASPISHKDFMDNDSTVKAEGLDFELIQPTSTLLSPIEDNSPISDTGRPPLNRQSTMTSTASVTSLRPLPETDEWGFLKDRSPVPEIFASRRDGGDHRVIEQKWLSIITSPLPPNTQPPKKVRKLVLDAGVPSSLRGKVWAWFMAGTLSARTSGLYQELIEHDNGLENERINKDVAAAYPNHSIFSSSNSAGQSDLRLILRAYSNFAPSGYTSEMALIGGALLIHCVAEDSFWLLSGLINSVLKDYHTNSKERLGLRIDSAVFMGLLAKEEPKLGRLLKEVGIHPISFLDEWFNQLFIRCLPWPTTLRVIDAVVSEGPRFLLIASLAILTLSKDRLLSLQKNPTTILNYLQNLPQDSLLLPDNFMKTCESIRFDEKDYKRLRSGVEKEIMG
ncbi:uncharacterized protein I303_104806 [Kwoniella dejecticola CBS 10117]|uniref:Rab-GAP TBC domain-containing protein n=1 Tax=Kwoniella dejecticola CBS 10117 TaxID=1296121 RepID=A0A1A6A4A7_9TREE|nr:uncharacterized protein I303_04213 [Kwoniella dejecticola CBS 10117]OBR84891.1 hypothetical protein I303_04213 [Kwoniella dejecticola CBS 10117]